jgi:hypothetical protein
LRDLAHVQTVKRHPGSSVGLAKSTSSWQRFRTIEGADIVQAQETSFENTIAALVFTIHPPKPINRERTTNRVGKTSPGEIQEQFLENALKEPEILLAMKFPFNLENSKRCPGRLCTLLFRP